MTPGLRASTSARVTTKVEPTPVLSRRLEELCADFVTCTIKLGQLEAKKKGVKNKLTGRYEGGLQDDLLKACDEHGQDSYGHLIVNDTYYVQRVNSENNFCDPVVLAELGVKASIIKKATRTTSYSYVQVRRIAKTDKRQNLKKALRHGDQRR